MKICIIVEGAYPYITGGVSNWIHQLVSNLSEHKFIIITIMPHSKKRGDFKYKLPDNIVNIHEVFLDDLLSKKSNKHKKANLPKEDMEEIGKLLSFNKVDWDRLFSIFNKKEMRVLTALDIQKSWEFYEEMKKVYISNYTHISFTEVYWSLRSMFGVLFDLLLQEYPDADIYHSVSTGYAGLVGAFAANSKNKGFILTEHGIYTREREEEIIRADWAKGHLKDLWIKYFYEISDCAYENAHKVIALFNHYKEIQIEIGCPKEKIEVIPNGINVEDFENVALEVTKRSNKKSINVGAVVRVVPIKDIITMLEAFSIVNKKINNVNFYIMGPNEEDPEYYEECLRYKEYLGLENVIFTGKINVKEHLSKMDLLVLTSISEGQPLVILEGLACKLPFVATNVGDCKSLILGEKDNFGHAGMILKVMDSRGIAEAIIELCNDKDKRMAYGEAGYKRVKEHYSFNNFIDRYRNIYNYEWK